MQNIDSDLIRGNIDTIILKTMLKEDKYGLDIIKEVSDKSSGTYELKQPTLYSCLKRLENQELISSYWVDSEIGGKRHYYKLTDKGREFYNKKQEEWAKSKFIIDNLLSNYDYEEYRLVKKDEFDEMLERKANAPIYDSVKETVEEAVEDNLANKYEAEEYASDDVNNANNQVSEPTNQSYDAFGDDNEFETEESLDLEDYESSEDNFVNESQGNEHEVFELGNNGVNEEFDEDDEGFDYSNNADDEDYPIYFDAKHTDLETDNQNNVSYETSDQSSNELNILSRLRDQEDETINTYYGDQKSYVNHLRSLDESQLEQQDLLDSSLYANPDDVNKSIDEFSEAIEKLNNFDSSASDIEEFDDTSDDEFLSENSVQDNVPDYPFEEETDETDDLDELKHLKNISSNAFFDSNDASGYEKPSMQTNDIEPNIVDNENDFEFEYEPETKSSMTFEEIANEIKPNEEFDIDTVSETEDTNYSSSETDDDKMNEIDSIISNNITATYTEPTQLFYNTQTTNYRKKLSDLSKYSRVNLEDEAESKVNEEALEKAKDIAEITKELEEEGIRVKEHYKQTSGKNLDRNYLLANKINLMKSLILFFGYVFILSAVYIILNNTSIKDNAWFNIKPFLIGFIPFGVVLAYYLILFIINPYKKIDSKFHFRIMLFISIIITIQLLLITYCINLQLGFYSFAQKEYNHLYWIIPGIISFAPIIDNLIYLALFKSKNFNV